MPSDGTPTDVPQPRIVHVIETSCDRISPFLIEAAI